MPALFEQVTPESVPRLTKVWGDSKHYNHALKKWMGKQRPTWDPEVGFCPAGVKGFALLAKRCVVERT